MNNYIYCQNDYKKEEIVKIISFLGSDGIKCYQCSSDTDPKGSDVCGSYNKFDKESNIAIECNTEESHMPGSFCVKHVQQSPRGFICKFAFNCL